uniref:Glycosyltransferase n=1 Tax=Rubia yunnanensis TaxID=1650721 RepID=A0A896AQG6_9GENT|nr:glycosyltransferase [Rubia yunnanensis]
MTTSAEFETRSLVSFEESFDVLLIPPVDISHLIDANTKVVTQLRLMVREALPIVRSMISEMKDRPDMLIADIFWMEACPIAAEFNMPKYLYVASNAWFAALTIHCPVLHDQIEGEYIDQAEPLEIPGCKPVRPEDVVDPMLDRNDQQYREYVKLGLEFAMGDGILINTWQDLEPVTLEAFRENESLRAVANCPVYPIGPLTRPLEPGPRTELFEWLDMQPPESVLYVSFGSAGTLSAQQITELACGLELSEHRFVWVVRPPVETGSDGSFFTFGNGSDGQPGYLPEGFATRTRNTGRIVRQWGPQMEILSHPSVGGFLTHCGWGSALESITNGVPMIAWPLYSEQRQNATMLAEELGVAIRPKVLPTKKVVEREEIEEMVRTLMEPKEENVIRAKVKQLKISGENAMEEGGSSYNMMSGFLKDVQMKLNPTNILF